MSLQESFFLERAWQSRKRGAEIPAGKQLEDSLFGRAHLERTEMDVGYMPFDDALTFATQHQPTVPYRSRPIIDLRTKVATLCRDTTLPVKFFTAVGTPLDIYHGVDAFFVQGDRVATVDASLREKDRVKADVLLVATFDKEGEVAVNDSDMSHAARAIADRLNAAPHLRTM